MEDLTRSSGLNVKLLDDYKLRIGEDLSGGEFSSRKLADLKDVLRSTVDMSNDRNLYYMYRDVRKPDDEAMIRENNLRYDMTVITPGMIGDEYIKTLGHYHPDKEGKNISYPEVYEVISGRAFYLLQRPKRTDSGFDFSAIEEAYLVEVKAGEKAIMPPDFGHVTINIDNEPIVMSNWVCGDFKSDYTEIKNYQGGCYYLVKDGDSYRVEKNTKYSSVPKLKVTTPKELGMFVLKFNQPMYDTGIGEIAKLSYLVKPEQFRTSLSPDKIFN